MRSLGSVLLAATLASLLPQTAAAQTRLSAEELQQRAIERRAVEAVNWGIPVVNFDRMYQAASGAGADFNQIVYWSGLFDWKNQTLTPNPDTIYFKPFFDTRDAGPMVLEIPPAGDTGSITGTIMDVWQAALEDVGPAGVDKGKGGRYLILPPGYTQTSPDGYIVLPSSTYEGFALLRSVLKSGDAAGVKQAVDYGLAGIKLYPLSQAADPPATRFVDVLGKEFDSTIHYDLSFFESLDRIVQYEPWLPRDKVMVDLLKSIGIEKGKPFDPDANTTEILEAAIAEARAWLDLRYETVFEPYFEGAHWAIPAAPGLVETSATFYETPNTYPIDARAVTDYWAFSTVKHLGAGQFYLMSTKDKDGRPLDGNRTYKLTVPADAPVTQYWSAVVYDRATHALIREVPSPSKSSQTVGLHTNADGAVDLYFGPKAPAGKESNWIPTKPGGRFEVLFRLYGPEKPLFEKTWILPDIEETRS
ncbi:DUF1254 domain-containing protein [Mesorhizobium sp.]|uniref:DUF1254 domain-containing protein n=1 Tax=Mesorhizobium sp. TaxID=1871066 RepID=UPI000FE9482F|nr:DUF1254 domain-containing protein [Mesorhizobium sp.]RWA98352.1 MAG: DUF1254 domain-containing protein [Mesorhizobium sp.]